MSGRSRTAAWGGGAAIGTGIPRGGAGSARGCTRGGAGTARGGSRGGSRGKFKNKKSISYYF